MSSGAVTTVKVAVRVRPLNAKEILSMGSECVRLVPNLPQIVVGIESATGGAPGSNVGNNNFATRSFTFDEVFGPDSQQAEVYEAAVLPLVERFLEGFNSTALAYGQTGSGKTWSMGTGLDSAALPFEQLGIVPRAINDIFSKLAKRKSQSPYGFKYVVAVSFLELYNEDLVDLLNPRPRTAGGGGGPTIREDAHGNIIWGGVKEEEVTNPEELLSVILKQQIWTPLSNKGSQQSEADQGGTGAIADSSATIVATSDPLSNPSSVSPETHPDGTWKQLTSKFHFVDLAGSERLKRTNAEGDRKKEGISINQGLLALGNVISALGDESRKSSHVPYRDSKLTRMLQDSLGGNSQTLMLACISPSDSNYGETVNTLNYANRARNIRNRVAINQEFFGSQTGGGGSAAEVRALRALVADLREEVANLRSGGKAGASTSGSAGTTRAAMDAAVVSRERQLQIHMQTERDLNTKLDSAKSDLRVAKFDLERLGFRCNRLAERNRDLNDELSTTTAERDAAVIELQKWRSGRLTLASVTSPSSTAGTAAAAEGGHFFAGPLSPDRPSPPSSVPSSPQQAGSNLAANAEIAMVASYNRTISELRLQLSEAEDRLAWYNEVMAELEGKQRPSSAQRALRLHFDPALDKVENRSFNLVRSSKGVDSEVAHESRLVKALRSDPELGKVLAQGIDRGKESNTSDLDNLKLYGLPKISTTSWRPSSLGHRENESDDDEDDGDHYDDDGEDDHGDDEGGASHEDSSPPRPRSALDALNRLRAPGSQTSLNPSGHDRSADMFLLIHRLQADIADHQAIVDRLAKRDQEYEAMRGAYEAKLSVLQTQVAAIARERDEALRRMRDGSGSGSNPFGREAARTGSAAIRARFDDEKKRLEAQIADLRKKQAEGARIQSSSKGRTDSLTKQLTATIEALKMEKAKMLKELKKESEKNRSLKTEKEREIARLRRKEKTAAEIAKKLERSNQLQRLMIKRRSEEVINSHSKLKSVLSLIKRNSGGSASSGSSTTRVQKPSGMASPTKRPRSRQYRSPTPANGGRESKYGNRSADDDALDRPKSPPPEVRAKFKRQMIEKEVTSVVNCRLAEETLASLKSGLERLIGEQRELLAERERCVAADAEKTGVYAPHLPQYMDERLGVLDLEIAHANARIKKVEDDMKLGRASLVVQPPATGNQKSESLPLSPPSFIPSLTDGELSWENEYVSSMFLDDIVALRVTLKTKESQLGESEKQISDLRLSLQTMRGAALKTAMDYRKELEEVRVEAARRIAAATGGSPPAKVLTPPTPRVQRMFDANYGQGVIVIAPSLSRESLTDEPDTFATIESKDAGWHVEDDNDAEFDPRRRGIAPAAAAALKSIRDTIKPVLMSEGISPELLSKGLSKLSHSPTRSPSFSKGSIGTPPRGKAAAEAAAIGAAAAALAKIADVEHDQTRGRQIDNSSVAANRRRSPSAHDVLKPDRGDGDNLGSDSSPPRGRQGRQSPEAGMNFAPSRSPIRSARDVKGEAPNKKPVNTKRGPPLSPRSASVSVTSSQQSLANATSPSTASLSGEGNNSLSPTRAAASTKHPAESRKRSPSWTYGRDSTAGQGVQGSGPPKDPAKRKTSTPAFSVNSSSNSIHADEVDEDELAGWQMFGLHGNNTAWGGTAIRPQSRTGRASKDSLDGTD
ncbi:hypothetical protein HDU96_000096, partial [Phlyctochytrium bullatum]